MAEFFRDVFKQDVLVFVDNVFIFLQAGSELSTLLGSMPSCSRLPPTPLATEMGAFQERIISIGPMGLYNFHTSYLMLLQMT